MTTDEIIDEIVKSKDADMIWKALCTTKLRSTIKHKYDIDVINTGIINPSELMDMMDTTFEHVADLMIESMGRRN